MTFSIGLEQQVGNNLTVNQEKVKETSYEQRTYERWAIKTCVVTDADDLTDIVMEYAAPNLQPGDVLFMSEKMVACTQGRAIPLKDIHPRWLARTLSRFVHKTPCGIGLGMPETMEMALQECGVARILLATICSAFGKLIGKHGWFYQIAGRKAASIDGPCHYTLPPYNEYVVLGPAAPDQVAEQLSQSLGGTKVLIVDLNDLGGEILGASKNVPDKAFYLNLLKDNPLGQTSEQTPMGIIRPVLQ